MKTRSRNYKAEYARRIARGTAKGISRSQARGHPKPSEAAVTSKRPPRPIEDERLQLAFKVLRQEKSLSAAARAAKISPERLRHFATKGTSSSARAADGSSGTSAPPHAALHATAELSKSSSATSTSASKIGRFMSAVSHFLADQRSGRAPRVRRRERH